MRYRIVAFRLSLISGILLILSGTTGLATWRKVGGMILSIADIELLRILFVAIFLIASLGGFAVMLGGYLIKKRYDTTGGILILIGSGSGVISLTINLFLGIITGELSIGWFMSLATIGIILAVMVQVMTLKRVQKFIRKI